MSGALQKENQLKQIILEIRMMEGTVNTLQQRLQIVIASLSELRIAKKSLEDLKKIETGTHLLVPIGGATFIQAKLGKIDKVVCIYHLRITSRMRLSRLFLISSLAFSTSSRNIGICSSNNPIFSIISFLTITHAPDRQGIARPSS